MSKNDYRFVDKDPVIDVIRSEMQRAVNDHISQSYLEKVSYESGVSVSTIRGWLFGDTRRPWSLSTRFVLNAIGVKIRYERDDGSQVRQAPIVMISQIEQAKILKAERERMAKRQEERDPERDKKPKRRKAA